jgi:hypothetical protein
MMTTTQAQPAPSTVGTMLGSGLFNATDYFTRKYGNAAAHAVIGLVDRRWCDPALAGGPFVRANTTAMGIVSARRYPLAFVGELTRLMGVVARVPEDDMVRQLAVAGIDGSVGMALKILLRYAASPAGLAARGQAAWEMFFDTGRAVATVQGNEYTSTISDWHGHDQVVCKLAMEVRRRVLERTGIERSTAHRSKCISWGNPACVTVIRW